MLGDELDDFAGVAEAPTADPVRPAKPKRQRGQRRARHVDPFSSGQPLPGEEPEPGVSPPAGPAVAVPKVYAAISAITAELIRTGIGKTKQSPGFYPYRGIDDIYNHLAALLVKHKLIILPQFIDRIATDKAARGGMLNYVAVTMRYELISLLDGSCQHITMPGEAMDVSDKAMNKALSTAYKYMAMEVFCIPTIGVDPEQDDYEVVAPEAASPPPEKGVAKDAGKIASGEARGGKAALAALDIEQREAPDRAAWKRIARAIDATTTWAEALALYDPETQSWEAGLVDDVQVLGVTRPAALTGLIGRLMERMKTLP